MTETKLDATAGTGAPRGVLAAVYITVAVAGLWLGRQGMFTAFSPNAQESSSLARVGFALQEASPPKTTPEDWAALRTDVDYVRGALNAQTGGVFDLVVAIRGLDNAGQPRWDRAEQICRALKWSRCERAALEDLGLRSRP